MPHARDLAIALSARFLENGNYTAAPAGLERSAAIGMMPAAVDRVYDDFVDSAAFAGLQVQAVGFAEDGPEEAVYVYVSKGSRKSLDALPESGDGVAVVGVRIGKMVIRPETAAASTNHGRVFERAGRIACGSSCSPAASNLAGTFGAIVVNSKDELFLLSNNHVFAACNHTPIGMPILSPANIDARVGTRAPAEIAQHAEIVELRSGVPALVPTVKEDAAIARITSPASLSSWQGGSDGYETPVSMIDPIAGLAVKKVGRTTGLTRGTIEALVPSPTPLQYKSADFTAKVWLSEFWTIRADEGEVFALSGDSGSLVASADGGSAVGLLFAATPDGRYAWIAPIKRVLQAFGGMNLVQGHG